MLWSRECILEYVDKEVFEIYKSIHTFFGQNVVHLPTPLLLDYICQNATCPQDAINIALQLRETYEMVQFRETMHDIDNAFNEGNLLLIDSLKHQLDEIINQFTRKEVPTVKITGSFSLTASLLPPAVAAEFGFQIQPQKGIKHRINLNFITNLVKHGLVKTYKQPMF